MLRHVALVRTDVSEEHITSNIRATRIGEIGTTLAVTSNCSTLQRKKAFLHRISWLPVTVNVVPSLPILVALMMDVLCSSEMSVL
jgi:hypothetical protein